MYYPQPSLLSEVIREILAAGILRRENTPLEPQEIVELALRRMQEDLHSNKGEEVIEEVRCEIAYQNWCAREGIREAMPNRRFGI